MTTTISRRLSHKKELWELSIVEKMSNQAKIKYILNRHPSCYGNLLGHNNNYE